MTGSSISVYYIGPIGLLAMPVYMKRSEPLVDAVRKSWELNADLHQFFLRNPAWTKRIESLLKEAVPGLGLKADQRRKIYKLVLKGPSYRKDSEKADELSAHAAIRGMISV